VAFTAQDVYQLAVDAGKNADELDLDRFAFLLESFEIGWLRPLLREDAPRLAPLLKPPAKPASRAEAIERAGTMRGRGVFTAKLAASLWEAGVVDWSSSVKPHIQRVSRESEGKVDTSGDSVAQRLYDLATACNVVATDYMIGRMADVLHHFQPDALDFAPIIADAPRIQAALHKLRPSQEFVRIYGPTTTTSPDVMHRGLHSLEFDIELNRGVCSAFSVLLRELFGHHGLTKDSSYSELNAALASKNAPHTLEIERRGRRPKYTCVYMWMIEDNHNWSSGNCPVDKPLADLAKHWDKELVARVVQPLIRHPREKLLKFIVCVANDREQAKALVEEYNRGWRDFSQGHLSAEMDKRDARHCILLDDDERPRAVFVWGSTHAWSPPSDRGYSRF